MKSENIVKERLGDLPFVCYTFVAQDPSGDVIWIDHKADERATFSKVYGKMRMELCLCTDCKNLKERTNEQQQ